MMVRASKTLAIKKENLEKRLARLSEEYAAINDQIDREGDADKGLQLQRKAENLFAKMEQVEDELNQLENCDKDLNQIHLELEKKLPKLDFQEPITLVESITRNFGSEGGAAFFLLDETSSMAGELCISRIREKFEEETTNFRYIKFEFSYGVRNEFGLLEGIGRYLNLSRTPEDDIENYAKQIIKIICQSLQSSSVVFIEIKKWNYLPEPEKILPWFLTNFWVRLIEEYRTAIQSKELRQVKFIALIDSERKLSEKCMTLPCYCTHEDFNKQKILKLPLSLWTEEDIKEWLEKYSGLPGSQIDFMANQIYLTATDGRNNGVPCLVCQAIKESKFT